MIDLGLLILGVAGVWGIGFAVADRLLQKMSVRSGASSNLIESLGLGLVFGFGLTGLFYFWWGLVGLPYSPMLARAWMGIGVFAGGGTFYFRRRTASQENTETVDSAESSFRKLCMGLILFLFATTVIQTLMTPQRFWDERAIFGLKAIVFYQDGMLQSESLLDKDFVQYHPKYPLLISLNESHVYLLLDKVNDRWSKVMFPFLYVGMVLTFLGVLLRLTAEKTKGWIFALMLATVPAMVPWEYGFLSGQADGPVACFHTVTLLYLWSFLKTRQASVCTLIIAGLAAGMTIFTKDEGIALFLVELIALLIVGVLYFRDRLLSTGLSIFQFGLVVVLIVAPWFYYRNQLPATTEMTYFDRMQISTLTEGFAALFWSVRHLFQRMFLEALEWGLQWWFLVASAIAFPLRAIKPHQLFLLLNILGALAALILAGMIAPTPVQEHIGGSSHRFLIQISGATVLFFAGQWLGDEESFVL